MAIWEENKHPRDKSGQFTSKGNEGQGGSDKEKDARKELGKKLAAAGYDINKLKSVEETLAEYDDFDNDYDFDKWEEETGYKKEEHVGYIDTNKTYKPDEILDIINSDDDWDVVAGGGFGDNNVWFQHKSGPNYVYDKKTGKLKLLSKNAFENLEGFNDDVNIDEVVSDNEYVYLGIKDKDQFVDLLHRRDNVPIDKAKEWVEKNWDEYQKYQEENDFDGDSDSSDINETEIDYENIEYPKGTSKEYTIITNKRYQDALPVLEKAGIKLEDFGGKASAEGGYEDNSKEIMDKYVFEPFRKKYPQGNNEVWEREYQPLYDAIESVLDKKYNDWWIKKHK